MTRATAFLAMALAAGVGGLTVAGQPAGPALPPGHPPVTAPEKAPGPPPAPRPADVGSLDAVIDAMFSTMSGGPGAPREWDRLRSLFLPESRFIAARPGEGGAASAWFLSVDDYIAFNQKYFEKAGYFEREVARRTEVFGNIAHVWSTYESRRAEDGPAYSRGIYSIQLLKNGSRWSIVNVYWDFERADSPIPARYLETPADPGHTEGSR